MPRIADLNALPRSVHRRTSCLCVRCRQYKPRESFYRNKLTPNGVSSYCKECYRDYYKSRHNPRS